MLPVLQMSTEYIAVGILVFLFLFASIIFLIYAIYSNVRRRRRRLTHRYSLVEGEPTEQRIPRTVNIARPFILALKNPDWEARSAATLALAYYGDESAFDPLVDILLHDSNEVVRENACSSLRSVGGEKAVDPLLRVVTNYLRDVETNADVATAAAEALGEIGSPRASRTLSALRGALKKKGLAEESKKVFRAVRKISSAMKIEGIKCVVCNLPVNKGENLVRCPCCGNLAHKDHMLEWLHIKGCCPVCSEKISGSELEEEKQA